MGVSKTVYKNIHQDIIDNCRKKDKKAQFQIYRLYYRNMYNISLRIVNDSCEAEDIMQESFLSAFERIESYKGEVSFGAWLKRIVINRSLDYVMKRKSHLSIFEESAEIPVEDGEDDDAGETGLKVAAVHRCMKMLPEGYRIILSLYLLEGYDHEEIGEILKISPSTSRSQYSRARHKLCSMLKNSADL
jgi:RNA polymerase sigma factor (sigma-70 family)